MKGHTIWIRLIVGMLVFVVVPALAQAQPGGRRGPRVVSPEVQEDGSVLFQVLAPDADSVELVSPDLGGLPEPGAFTKNDQGVWSLKYGPVDPRITMRYRFNVDGVTVADPSARGTSEANGTVFSLVHMPGLEFQDVQDIAHGAVAEVTYYSKVLQRFRRLHVYTPPGYQTSRDKYPVFYLLHGATDSDDSWSTIGRANVILDNLIVAGKAVPMIVVMPDGHVTRRGMPNANGGGFVDEFAQDIRPAIEKTYRVHTDRAHRAVAGLSMGGAQTLNIAFKDLADYGYIGVFSSGIFRRNRNGEDQGPSWEERHLTTLQDPDLKEGLDLLWFATGRDDFLIETSRNTVALFEKHGFDVTWKETEGGHWWRNWRDYLHEFAAMLFQAQPAASQDSVAAEITITRDIPYREGDSDAWKLDLAMPVDTGGGLRPGLVIVHGGGWRGGSKEVDVYQKMMTDYARKGYVTINIDYRLLDEAPFPACIEDVKCAVRWFRAHADEYRVDPDRIGAYGHSAGAHLAMMLAMVPTSAGLEGDGGWDAYSSRVNVAAAGSPPTELGRDRPMAKTEWWPIGYISADQPPMFLIQGSDDRIVREELTDDFVEKMKAEGAPIEYLKIDGARHGVAYNEHLDVTDPAIEAFFAKHLKPEVNGKSAETGAGAEGTSAMDALLQSFVDEKKVSSVVGFVAQDGQVKYQKAFGWKDVENQVPATVDDYYVLFSQTKAVVTVAFMTLVEKGLVAIDDPVAKYFPEIPDRVVTEVHEDGTYETRPVASPMTFAHLMSHSSGLNAGLVGRIRRAERQSSDRPGGFGRRRPGTTPSGQHSGGGDYSAKYLEDEMRALVKYPLGFDPGSEWSYHVSTNMLGYLIERISGKTLRQYVKETVLEPLGMDETDWYYEPDALDRFVKAYRAVDGDLEPASNMYSEGTISTEQTYCEGAIGLNGPIGDYAKFCQMLLNQGELNGHRILKPETVELMTTVNQLPEKSAGGEGFQFGLGFELYNEQKKPVPEVSNSAFAWGGLMGTQYIIDPGHDLIALFYINMYGAESLYPSFLGMAYQLFAPSGTSAVLLSENERL